MRLRQPQNSGIPEVNLVPMMDVLMSVLTFFVIATLTMTGQNIPGVELPSSFEGKGGKEIPHQPEKLHLALSADQRFSVNNQELASEEAIAQVQQFIQENPDGIVVLNIHRSLAYGQIEALLRAMSTIGVENVSWAVKKAQP